MRIFGREPAVFLGLIVTVISVIFAFFVHVDPTVQAWIIAVATALWGVIVAAVVHDGLVAAILGFAQSVLALVVGLGIHWSSAQQALLMTLVVTVISMFTRTQVTAPQPAPPAAIKA